MAIAKTCPVCRGEKQIGLMSSDDSKPPELAKCYKCNGVGVVASVDGAKFANGMSVDEYLQERFR